MTKEFPYDAGNAGDLIKHGFLAEFVRAWCQYIDKDLFFFDPFAGLPWHEPINYIVASRITKLSDTALAIAQSDISRRYYGSSYVVLNSGKAFDTVVKVFASDKDEISCSRLRSAGLEIINVKGFNRDDGFSILETNISPDLLLLDPFSDFLPRKADEVIPKLYSFSKETTIVLFILNLNPHNLVGQRYRSLIRKYCSDSWLAKCPPLVSTSVRGESKYFSELLIVPAKTLPMKMISTLFLSYQQYCNKLHTIMNTKATFETI